MVGFSHNVGHALTFKVLTDKTGKIIHRSRLRLASAEENRLEEARRLKPQPTRTFIQTKRDIDDPDYRLPTLEAFDDPFVPSVQEDSQVDHEDITKVGESHTDSEDSTPADRGVHPSEDRGVSRSATVDGLLRPNMEDNPDWDKDNVTMTPLLPVDDVSTMYTWWFQLGTRLKRRFPDGNWYDGTVVSRPWKFSDEINTPSWEILYDDGDRQYLCDEELRDPKDCQILSTPDGRSPTPRKNPSSRTRVPPTPNVPHITPTVQNATPTSTVHDDAPTPGSSNTDPPSAKTATTPPVVETVSDEEEDYHSPLDDRPLSDEPEVDVSQTPENLPAFMRDAKPYGTPNPENIPRDFTGKSFATINPVEPTRLPPEQLISRTVLFPSKDNGTRYRAEITQLINDHHRAIDLENHPECIKFKYLLNGEYEEVVAYNDIVDYIEKDQTWDGLWQYRKIHDHKAVGRRDKMYMGSSYNVLVEFEDGSTLWQPLHTTDKRGVMDTDPVTVAIYARENGLLNTKGWKHQKLRSLAKTQKRIIRAAKQAKLLSFRTKPI